MANRLFTYLVDNFSITDRYLIRNICDWVFTQSMDKEDTINCLLCILDGVGIKREEIERLYQEEENA